MSDTLKNATISDISGYAVLGCVMLFPILLVLISFSFHRKRKGTDFPGYISLFKFFNSIGDLYTDFIWALTLYVDRDDNDLWIWACLFSFGPHILSILIGLMYLTKWRQTRSKLYLSEFAKKYDKLVIVLTIISGFYATTEIITSHLFHLAALSLPIGQDQRSKIMNLKIINNVILENIPSFYLQYKYLTQTTSASIFENGLNITLLSMSFSIVAIIFGVITVTLRLFNGCIEHTRRNDLNEIYIHFVFKASKPDIIKPYHIHTNFLLSEGIHLALRIQLSQVEIMYIQQITDGIKVNAKLKHLDVRNTQIILKQLKDSNSELHTNFYNECTKRLKIASTDVSLDVLNIASTDVSLDTLALSDNTTDFVTKGAELIEQAVQKDNAEEYEAALSLYGDGIQYLITGLKHEENEMVVSEIKIKVQKYLKRAEDIKISLEGAPKKTTKKGGDSDDEDTASIVIVEPNIRWDDVAGLETVKQLLKETVIWPIKFPQLFQDKRKSWGNTLLYGPPGAGKSYLAAAIATEALNSTIFSVSSSDLVSKSAGESEQLVKNLFNMAREKKPSIIFIDELDSLAWKRGDNEQDNTRRIRTEFLTQMQGIGKDTCGVLTLGATNCPWDLDPAIRRLFVKRIYVPLPEKEERQIMFKIYIGKIQNSLNDQDYAIMAERTDGFSGSDIMTVVEDALMEQERTMQIVTHFVKAKDPENECPYIWLPCSPATPNAKQPMEIPENEIDYVRMENLKLAHFLRALADAKPSVGKEDIKRYTDWTAEFGQEG